MKFRRNRCKIIIFEFPFTTETLNLKWNQIECGKIEKSDHFTASHKTFCFPSFPASLKASIAIFFEDRFCASFEEKTLRNDISSSSQLWGKLQNIHFTNNQGNAKIETWRTKIFGYWVFVQDFVPKVKIVLLSFRFFFLVASSISITIGPDVFV